MKRIIYLITLFVLTSVINTNKVFASHAMGMDLSYQHVVGNFYRVTLTYYRDCSGFVAAPASVNIDFNSLSGCGTAFNENLPLSGVGTEVSPLCPSQIGNSSCNGGAIPGVEQYTYEALVEIATPCDDWNLSYSECCRNDAGGLSSNIVTPTTWDIYVEAQLDNLTQWTNPSTGNVENIENSCPQFTTLPVPYICSGQEFTYNHGAYDPDGDSLVYSLINPQDGPYPGTNINYDPPATAVNPLVGVANTFDSQTGSIVVNPDGSDELAVMVILVEEYRTIGGVPTLIGSTMRDIQVVIQNCTNVQPQDDVPGLFAQSGGVYIDGNSIEVCPGEALSFDIRYNDANGDDITMVTNLGAVIPTATFTQGPTVVSGMASTSTASFSWTPTGADAGFHTFTVTVQDDGCPILGSQVFAFDILVQDGTYAGADQTYCPGGIDPQLNVTGGTIFNWTYLGDGDGSGMGGASVPVNGNFSCNPCANPIPLPGSETTYIVTSNLSSLCKNKDTVTITTDPGFALTMPSNQTICLNEAVNLPLTHPAGSYTYNWTPNTGLSNPGVQNPLASPSTTQTYSVTVTDNATGCRNQDNVDVTVSGVGPMVLISNDTSICAGDPVPLLATPLVAPAVCGLGSPCGGGTVDYTYGTGTSSSATYGPYRDGWDDSRIQILFLASELATVGMIGNTISEIAFDIASVEASGPESYDGFNVKMGCTALTDLTSSFETGLTTVFTSGMGSFSPGGTGWDYITLDDPYDWDGTNNLLIEICWDNSAYNTSTASLVNYHTASGTKFLYDYADSDVGCNLSTPITSSLRPNMRFRTCDGSAGSFSYAWSGGLASVANPTATPATTTNYIVDVTDLGSGCRGTASMDIDVGAAFTLNAVASNPAICYGNNVSLNANTNVGGAYTYSWTPSNNLINNFTSSATASPSGTTKYYVDVDNGGCLRRDSVTVNVSGVPISATVDNDSICPGDPVQLDVGAAPSFCGVTTNCGGVSNVHTVGAGVSQTSTTPYEGFYSDGRMQILYTAADLLAMGVTPGAITAIAFNVGTNGSTKAYSNFTISMAGVSLSNLGGFQAGTTPVYGPTSYTVAGTGWQTHTLDSPFSWDGTCNLLVEICFDNTGYTSDDDVFYTTTAYTSVAYAYADGSATGGCGETLDGTNSNRPNTRFTVCATSLPGAATYTWSGGTVSNTGIQNPTSTPSSSVTYDVSVDDGSCITTSQVRVGVNQSNVLATTDNNTRCTGEVANLNSTLSDIIPPICDSYTYSSIPVNWNTSGVGWTGTGAQVTGDYGYSSSAESIPIGFDFDFYCNTFTNVYGNANGYLSFDVLTGSGGYTAGIPSTTTANNQIAFATEDLVCTAVRYRTDGTAPNRVFTYQYAGYQYSDAAELVRVQILLYETTNVIEIHVLDIFDDASFPGTMTMGIENEGGTVGVTVPGRNNTSWSAFNEGHRFTPDAGAVYSWSPTTGLDDATVAAPVYTAPDNNTRDFIVTVTGGLCEMKDTVTIGCTVLPFEAMNFNAKANNKQVDLDWSLLTSTNEIKEFIVERSSDGNKFIKVGSVTGSIDKLDYFFSDLNPIDGASFYRLKMIQKDESYKYSEVKKVFFDNSKNVNIYPNPSLGADKISIDFSTAGSSINVKFLDVSGRSVIDENYKINNNESTISISTSEIPEGVYIYKVLTLEGEYYGKIIINK